MLLGNLVIPSGERRRRGTRAALCYPASRQRVAVSVQTVVPRARLEAWIGEPAASSLVTTPPWGPRAVSIPVGRLPLPATPPLADLVYPWLILEDAMPR